MQNGCSEKSLDAAQFKRRSLDATPNLSGATQFSFELALGKLPLIFKNKKTAGGNKKTTMLQQQRWEAKKRSVRPCIWAFWDDGAGKGGLKLDVLSCGLKFDPCLKHFSIFYLLIQRRRSKATASQL